MTRFVFLLSVLVVVTTPASAWAHGHGEDFLVGVNALTDQLQVEYDPDIYPFALPLSEHPLLAGWALDDPGLIGLHEPDPDDPDFVPVDAAADIGFELLAVSGTVFNVWNPLGPGEPGFRIRPGQTYNFPGLGDFHEHVWWHIDAADPGYDPTVTAWGVTFRFVDLRSSGAHLPSDPASVTFTPEPSAAWLLAAGVLVVARRRRCVHRGHDRALPGERGPRLSRSFDRPFDGVVRRVVCGFLLLLVASVAALGQHSGDVGVGRSAAGQLKCRLSDEQNPCFEPAVGIGLLTPIPDPTAPTSWRATSPGFDANFAADPAQDYYQLDSGAAIYLVAAEDLQPAFTVKYGTTTIRAAGDALPLGSATLHRHAIFVVDCTDPHYDPLRTLWYGTFVLEDRGGTGYADSEPFTLRLSVVECATGDVDGDGAVSFADINLFISVIVDPAAASVEARCGADVNRDGYVTFGDINPFVFLLSRG